jgi:hypothetical protein
MNLVKFPFLNGHSTFVGDESNFAWKVFFGRAMDDNDTDR